MKIKLELNFCETGTFLNYWDSLNGNDFCCKVQGNELETDDRKLISIGKFITIVKGIEEKK
jgi:hypothetical protein